MVEVVFDVFDVSEVLGLEFVGTIVVVAVVVKVEVFEEAAIASFANRIFSLEYLTTPSTCGTPPDAVFAAAWFAVAILTVGSTGAPGRPMPDCVIEGTVLYPCAYVIFAGQSLFTADGLTGAFVVV